MIQKLNLPSGEGVLVAEVQADSPAGAAGVQRYDLIRAVEGTPVVSAQEFLQQMEKHMQASSVQLRLWRAGDEQELTVVRE